MPQLGSSFFHMNSVENKKGASEGDAQTYEFSSRRKGPQEKAKKVRHTLRLTVEFSVFAMCPIANLNKPEIC